MVAFTHASLTQVRDVISCLPNKYLGLIFTILCLMLTVHQQLAFFFNFSCIYFFFFFFYQLWVFHLFKGVWLHLYTTALMFKPKHTIGRPCSCVLLGCRRCGYHLSTTAGCLPASLASHKLLSRCCCGVIDDRSVGTGLAKFPILPQGNCSFLLKSISIFATRQCAKFMHYAAAWMQNWDKLHPALSK